MRGGGAGWVRAASRINALAALCVLLLFVRAYSSPFPISDEWMSSLPVATSACAGTLSPNDLLRVTGGGHRTLFTHLQTALSARLFDWRLDVEVFLNPLIACGSFLLLVALLRRHFPGLVATASIPIAWFVFSFYQHLNWIMPWQSAWHFVNLFVIGALVLVSFGRPGWPALGGAALLAACATFSRSHGMVAWPVLLAAMWMRGYRLSQRVAWIAAAVATVALYVRGSGITVGGSRTSTWSNVDPREPLRVARTVLSQLGAPMGSGSYPLAVAVGALGLCLLCANAIYLWRRLGPARARELLAPWIALAGVAVGSAAMVGAARMEVMTEVGLALWGGYSTTAILLWVAAATLVTASMAHLREASWPRGWTRLLALGNVIAVVVVVPLYVQTHQRILDEWEAYYGSKLLGGERRYQQRVTKCIVAFPVHGERDCLGEEVVHYVGPSGDEIYRLAALRLSVFADPKPLAILPPSYGPDSPVVVGTQSALLNLYVRDQMLPNVPPDRVFHIAPHAEIIPAGGTVEPLHRRSAVLTREILDELSTDAGTDGAVWYIGTSEAAPLLTEMIRRMGESGFSAEQAGPLPPRYEGGKFVVWKFARPSG